MRMIKNIGNVLTFKKHKYQIFATCLVNIISISHGIGMGWLSPVLLILQSKDSPLDSGPITVDESSWIGSLVCFGGLIGNLLGGAITEKFGRKNSLRCIAIPHFSFWLTIILATDVKHWYAARFVSGIGGGILYLSLPLYILDIADNSVRGILGSTFLLSLNFGTFLGFVFGAYLNYYIVPKMMVTIPIVYIILITFIPDTPQDLIKQKKYDRAKISYTIYKNVYAKSKEERQVDDREFDEIKSSIEKNDTININKKLHFRDFVEPNARKAFILGLVLMILIQFSGCFLIITYASSIFQESGSQLHPNDSAIILGFIQLVGSYISTILVDRCGRKILLSISSLGASLGLLCIGAYSFLSFAIDMNSLKWIPIICLSFTIFISSLAVINLPFVVIGEILPSKVRGIGITILMCFLSLLAFGVLKIFPILMIFIKLYGTMWICSIVCLAGGIFIIIFLPETKGKSLIEMPEIKESTTKI